MESFTRPIEPWGPRISVVWESYLMLPQKRRPISRVLRWSMILFSYFADLWWPILSSGPSHVHRLRCYFHCVRREHPVLVMLKKETWSYHRRWLRLCCVASPCLFDPESSMTAWRTQFRLIGTNITLLKVHPCCIISTNYLGRQFWGNHTIITYT
jgi:hypothetical protein